MQFGREVGADEVEDWSLPADDGSDGQPPAPSAEWRGAREAGRLLLGAPGWSSRSLASELAGAPVAASARLNSYARHCAAVELNATFYGVAPERCRAWAEQVPADFRFVAKIPRHVSHARGGPALGRDLDTAAEGLHELGDHLAACFLQLPESYAPDRLPQLLQWLAAWNRSSDAPFAVELRHRDWFRVRGRGALDQLCDQLAKFGASLLITDTAGRRDVLHMRRTAPWVMVRWVGNGGHPSDQTRLDAWAQRLLAWRASGTSWAAFFLHQKDEAHCVAGVRQLAEDGRTSAWRAAGRLWKRADESDGDIEQRTSGQQSLF